MGRNDKLTIAEANNAHDQLANVVDELKRGKFIPNLVAILETIYDQQGPMFIEMLRRR